MSTTKDVLTEERLFGQMTACLKMNQPESAAKIVARITSEAGAVENDPPIGEGLYHTVKLHRKRIQAAHRGVEATLETNAKMKAECREFVQTFEEKTRGWSINQKLWGIVGHFSRLGVQTSQQKEMNEMFAIETACACMLWCIEDTVSKFEEGVK